MKKTNVTLLNAISSFILQIVTIITGFIIPRFILTIFGSEVNGLVSSLNQFLGYISLLEGGISSVIMANLYKPLAENDAQKISSIVKTAQKFFNKIGIIFIVYTIILAIIYPLFFNKTFDYIYICSLTFILSLTSYIQYVFALSYKLLLTANRKVYIVSFTQIITTILNVIIFGILIKIFPNIHVLKLLSALIFIIQPIVYRKYTNKFFKIDKQIREDKSLLKSRWDGFGINIAAFMHYNTDIVILTIFSNLKVVSIYSVYALVANGLRQLIVAISTGISPTIGQAYAKQNIDDLKSKFDKYEFVITFLTTFCFTIAGLLITPFVMVYTSKVVDTNYYQPTFGILLILSEAVFCLKEPFVCLAYSANKFKDIKIHAYIEALLNMLISIFLVRRFSLIGVAIGTLIAMLYRTSFHIFYLKKHIINRPIIKFLKKVLLFSIGIVFVTLFAIFVFPITEFSWLNLVLKGLIYSTILFIVLMILSFVCYKEEVKYFINMISFKKDNQEAR